MPLFHPRIIEKHNKAPAALHVAHADIMNDWIKNPAFKQEPSRGVKDAA